MDKKASVEKYAETIREAGRQGVDLIVTPETGIPVYPYWRNNFGYTDPESARRWKETVVAFYDEAVRIPGPETEELGQAAKAAGLTAVIGLNEQDDRLGSRTLHNTMLFIGPDCARDLLTIRPGVQEPGSPVFRLSASQIGRRIKEAGKVAGLGDGFTGHSGRIGMARDLSAAGVELPAFMTAGR